MGRTRKSRRAATTAPAETAWVSVDAWMAEVEGERWAQASVSVQGLASAQLRGSRWMMRGGDDAYSRGSAGARR